MQPSQPCRLHTLGQNQANGYVCRRGPSPSSLGKGLIFRMMLLECAEAIQLLECCERWHVVRYVNNRLRKDAAFCSQHLIVMRRKQSFQLAQGKHLTGAAGLLPTNEWKGCILDERPESSEECVLTRVSTFRCNVSIVPARLAT